MQIAPCLQAGVHNLVQICRVVTMNDYLDGAKLHDIGDGERVNVTVAGVPVTVLRAFEMTTQRRTQRRRFEFRTTDAGSLTVTAFDAVPALSVPELLALDWSALSLRAFELASAPVDRRAAAVEHRDTSLAALSASVAALKGPGTAADLAARDRREAMNPEPLKPGRKPKVERTPEMLARVVELHAGQGIEAVRREFGVSTRTAYNYLSEAMEQAEQGADK